MPNDMDFLERLDKLIDRFCDDDGGLLEDVVTALEMKLDLLREQLRDQPDKFD